MMRIWIIFYLRTRIDKIVGEARGRNLFFSTDVEKAIDEAQVILSRLIHYQKNLWKRDGGRSKIH
jgi:hypothetical protein